MSSQTYFTIGLSRWDYFPPIGQIYSLLENLKNSGKILSPGGPGGILFEASRLHSNFIDLYSINEIEGPRDLWGLEENFLHDLEVSCLEKSITLPLNDLDLLLQRLEYINSEQNFDRLDKFRMSYFYLNTNSIKELQSIVKKNKLNYHFNGFMHIHVGIHACSRPFFDINDPAEHMPFLGELPHKVDQYQHQFSKTNPVDFLPLISYLGHFSISYQLESSARYGDIINFYNDMDSSDTVQSLKEEIRKHVIQNRSEIDIITRIGRRIH